MFIPWLGFVFQGYEENKTSTSNSGTGSDTGSETSSTEKDTSAEGLSGLKSALAVERKARKDLEKKLNQLAQAEARAKQTEEEKIAQLTKDFEASKTKSSNLAAAFLAVSLEEAIRKAAIEAKFRDPSDAIAMVDRSTIVVDQDEDNPHLVEVDSNTVKTAIKKLADVKKHLLLTGTEDGGQTGSQFGAQRKGGQLTEADYKAKYTSL